jgi:hypothetical protein
MRRGDILILGLCVGLGACLIVVTGGFTTTIFFVGVLLLLLLLVMGTRLLWP